MAKLGPIRIPPLPRMLVMTDRADGKLWLLTHDRGDTAEALGYARKERMAIMDEVPEDIQRRLRGEVQVYGPEDGPFLAEHPHPRLFIENGRLGYEYDELPLELTDRDNAPICSRVGSKREVREIVFPDGWRPDPPWPSPSLQEDPDLVPPGNRLGFTNRLGDFDE